MKAIFLSALSFLVVCAPALAQDVPSWRGYAGNAQHTAPALAKAQKLKKILWHTPVDLDPQNAQGVLAIHYASPMITASNTILIPVKTGASNGFQIEAHSANNKGELVWNATTDFILAHGTALPSFPAHLTAQNRFYYAGVGGTVYYRDTPDLKTGASGQIAFFGNANYTANKSAYDQHVMIDTPITADEAGNIYFGFVVTGTTPQNLMSGIARIGANGQGNWVSATEASSDSDITLISQNCAPAVSADQLTIYIAVSNGPHGNGYLVGLDSTTLAQKYKVRLKEPIKQKDAILFDESTSSPTVGPDGDVYYGVEASGHDSRGWLLHFSADLATQKIPGSFGWDDTASIVPAAAVPSYTGPSSYLLMTKYNNYYGAPPRGDGHNEIAILDPNVRQKDRFSRARVMKEVMTKVGPTQFPGAPAGVVYEWCINTAVVDAVGHGVIANSEDGHTYRWDLNTGELTGVNLNPPIIEAYTPTEIGPDGTIYAINNAVLYALGK